MARLVVPDYPHHVTQRGVRRMEVFFGDDDCRTYLALLGEWCERADTRVWAYCLMPNHIHLILVPATDDGLRAALGETHRRYTRRVNAREGWRGHLWQECFYSIPMDEDYLLACARYVELNPVRARLAARPEKSTWSSARAHLARKDGEVVETAPLLERAGDWRGFLDGGLDDDALDAVRRHARTGYPLGSAAYCAGLERRLGRSVTPRRPGRPSLEANAEG